MNEQHYKDAIQIAKNELDEILPGFNKLQERVTNLRAFIVAGTVLSGDDARDLHDKYKLQWMVREEMRSNFHSSVKRSTSEYKNRGPQK